jgi:hypothetical protein
MLKLNADFVVLSACNTAAGDKPGAEALSGLARAFFYAGAKSLVVSHWEVDSEATVALMDGLFEALKANPRLSHAEALRLSMLRMIANSSKPEWAQPEFWAPFVVVGEPMKLVVSRARAHPRRALPCRIKPNKIPNCGTPAFGFSNIHGGGGVRPIRPGPRALGKAEAGRR